jgi:L-iditol 2-dehydrogenase
MLAVRVHGPGDLRVDRVPVPAPGPGDLLLRVLAAGVCATDRKLAARGAPGGGPRVLGHEIVAEVAAGDDARLPRGTRVAVAPNLGEGSCPACRRGATNLCPDYRAFGIHLDGGMAEYVLVPRAAVEAGHLLPLPDGLSDLDAALLEPLACCVEGLEASGLRAGESLLVVAAGVMGRLHVAAARALGAGTVIVADRSEERLAHARALGADVTVRVGNGATGADDLAAAVAAATDGAGVDVAAVTIGDPPPPAPRWPAWPARAASTCSPATAPARARSRSTPTTSTTAACACWAPAAPACRRWRARSRCSPPVGSTCAAW